MRSIHILIFFTSLLLLTSCGHNASDNTNSSKNKIAPPSPGQLEQEIKQLHDQVYKLQVDNNINELTKDADTVATFDPTEPGPYQPIRVESGYLLVSFVDAQPYLNGLRITLNIGNPMAMAYSGFIIHASWSPAAPAPTATTAEYEQYGTDMNNPKINGSKDIEMKDDLLPEHWNKVHFIIAPVNLQKFGLLSIKIKTNEVKLYK